MGMSNDCGQHTYGLPGALSLDPNVHTQGMNMLRVKERRADQREEMCDTILFRLVAPGKSRQFLSGLLRDISSGGILFETESKPAEGDLIDIFFKRQVSYADTCARAEIVRVSNLGARFEVGARFV